MEFINRKKELEELENYYDLSQRKLFPIVLTGQRRIGKTRLIKEFSIKKDSIYFFVDDRKNSLLLLNEFVDKLKEENLIGEFEKISNWREFFRLLFKRSTNKVIIFDEFQNFNYVEKSCFSIIQSQIDENEDNPFLLVFLGSIIGLMRDIFENQKEPLFGRIKANYYLKSFSFKEVIKLCLELGFKNFEFMIQLYSVFGGYPRYYVLLEDYNIKEENIFEMILKLVLEENSILKEEVLNTLKLNFGGSKLNYYSILEAVGNGNTKISQIANYIGQSVNTTSFFLNELTHYYNFLTREVPITDIYNFNKSKSGIYKIENNFFDFYFKFVFKNRAILEFEGKDKLLDKIKQNFNSHVAKTFEDICQDFIKNYYLDFQVGFWWNRKGEEIDICAIDKEKKKILFGECKFKEKIDAKRIYEELRKKSKLVDWNLGNRGEEFVIFAKSFKEKVEFEGLKLYDLKDLEEEFLKNERGV